MPKNQESSLILVAKTARKKIGKPYKNAEYSFKIFTIRRRPTTCSPLWTRVRSRARRSEPSSRLP